MRVPFVCAACGHRADAVAFQEARGHSRGMNASPDAAQSDAENRARDQLVAVVHVVPCPRCGQHDPQLVASIAEATRQRARTRNLRRTLGLGAFATIAAAVGVAVAAIVGPLAWWFALVGVGLLPIPVVLGIMVLVDPPAIVPGVYSQIPSNVRFEPAALPPPFR